MPPIQECHLKHNFILYLNQCRNSSVNTNKDSITIDTNKDNIIDISTDNTDDDDNDERLSVEMEIIPNSDEPMPVPIDITDTNSQVHMFVNKLFCLSSLKPRILLIYNNGLFWRNAIRTK